MVVLNWGQQLRLLWQLVTSILTLPGTSDVAAQALEVEGTAFLCPAVCVGL